ncbi:DUF3285 domain-containing protein [Prochlorothrix hollandica]|uniref:DUF3285 domain-containing protein n=1 Tax=Prochlorothrix hollandica TaxID=1223 RepID=UPI003899E6EC
MDPTSPPTPDPTAPQNTQTRTNSANDTQPNSVDSPSPEPVAAPPTPGAPPPGPPPTYTKLAMRNMVKKGRQSLVHFFLTALGLLGAMVGLAYLTR